MHNHFFMFFPELAKFTKKKSKKRIELSRQENALRGRLILQTRSEFFLFCF